MKNTPGFRARNFVICAVVIYTATAGQIFGNDAAPRVSILGNSIFSYETRLLAADQKISDSARRALAGGQSASAVILMADQADLSEAYTIADHDARGWFVYRSLTANAELAQANLKHYLSERGIRYSSFWVANMIVADLDMDTAVDIAGRSDVARIDANNEARWVEPPGKTNATDPQRPDAPAAIEWGITNVNAPAVWAQGFSGQGIVVGGLDTGIRWTHNAIKSKYRGWNGTTADHNFNWRDAVHSGGGSCGANTGAPCDDSGHGSHTVGTMVGDDGAGNQIGVAPGAKWVGCRNMDVGFGTVATYAECFQFMIAPTDLAGNNANPSLRPHILNNSWSCFDDEGCTTRAELEQIVNSTVASGIFVQTSAGNRGPNCSTVMHPAGIYEASFAAGAININNGLANISSRGPSTFYDPNLLKPNITAPGVNVRSIVGSSDTGYSNSTGTSMASPHVAGVVALLWSARPALVRNIAATKTLLQNTANPDVTLSTPQTCGGISSTQIPNNSFGYGRVDALAAFNASAVSTITVSGRVLTPEGTALRNAVVTLIDSAGVRRTATTSSFGFYTFGAVNANASYTLTVTPRRYRFAPKVITTGTSDLSASDFVGLQ